MTLAKDLNYQSAQVRVKAGENIEEEICECLNSNYGWNLQVATFAENTRKKIDRWIDGKKGRIPVQVKARATGDDILYCLYQPFFGVGHEDTRIGRDHKGKFKIYICCSTQGIIRVVKVDAMRKIIAELEEEWINDNTGQLVKRRHGCKEVFRSVKFPGCEIRQHTDKATGVSKVLCFLSVEAFEKGKDIQFYRMK
jgi:hypothetical protein